MVLSFLDEIEPLEPNQSGTIISRHAESIKAFRPAIMEAMFSMADERRKETEEKWNSYLVCDFHDYDESMVMMEPLGNRRLPLQDARLIKRLNALAKTLAN